MRLLLAYVCELTMLFLEYYFRSDDHFRSIQ
jgi:hypothetical protein